MKGYGDESIFNNSAQEGLNNDLEQKYQEVLNAGQIFNSESQQQKEEEKKKKSKEEEKTKIDEQAKYLGNINTNDDIKNQKNFYDKKNGSKNGNRNGNDIFNISLSAIGSNGGNIDDIKNIISNSMNNIKENLAKLDDGQKKMVESLDEQKKILKSLDNGQKKMTETLDGQKKILESLDSGLKKMTETLDSGLKKIVENNGKNQWNMFIFSLILLFFLLIYNILKN